MKGFKKYIFIGSCIYIILEFVMSLPILLIMYATCTEKIIGLIMLILTLIATFNIVMIGGDK